MAEVARIRWTSPPPTAVDEELVVYDDSTVHLVVRGARDRSPVIGTYGTSAGAADLAVLTGQDREVDLRHAQTDEVLVAAERLAAAARELPLASATFHAAALPDGTVALQVVGGGTAAADFQLDRTSVLVYLERDGTDVSWHEMEPLQTGFMSPDAIGLGGVGRPAEIGPGAYGTIALSGPPVTGPGEVSVEVAGTLHDALRERNVGPFRVRTAAATLP